MIAIENLHKRYGESMAVDGLSFEARDGEITGLLGANGAGKTTTLRIIAGVLVTEAGRVRISGGPGSLGGLLDHAGATWVFLVVAWGFGVWNRRGAWHPVALSSSAYLEISIRRCRSAIRAVIFGVVLFVVEVLFCLAWIYNRTGDASFLYSTAMMAVGVATVVFFMGSLMYRARKKGELAWLLQLEKWMR